MPSTPTKNVASRERKKERGEAHLDSLRNLAIRHLSIAFVSEGGRMISDLRLGEIGGCVVPIESSRTVLDKTGNVVERTVVVSKLLAEEGAESVKRSVEGIADQIVGSVN